MEYLYDALLKYQASEAYPFHMPGHKRRKNFVNPFFIDITEIYGFDNLHHAEGILKEAQKRAAVLYGAEETHFLVNGSTCGILSAISACTAKGGKILMARNCHKAVYHGALLQELEVIYLYPEKENSFGINGGIFPDQVKQALNENPDIQAVIVTSPTYDGVVSDIGKIAGIVHQREIPLIVDEAHGAHFGFHPYFPKSAVQMGADLVIHSLHKTLPSLTQTALLHVNGKRVDREKLRMYLGIYQSSSPSYVFMAGMDECIRTMQENAKEMFEKLKENLEKFYKGAEKFSQVRLAGSGLIGKSGVFDFDRSKLVISVKGTGMDGNWLDDRLRNRYHLELEMAAGTYALALTSVSDTAEGFQRLYEALMEIDHSIGAFEKKDGKEYCEADNVVTKNEHVCRISEALESPKESVLLEKSEGRISREFLYLYPPGIPILVPGERISRGVLDKVKQFQQRGYSIQGLEEYSLRKIQVMK